MKPILCGMTQEELSTFFKEIGEKPYRASQTYGWVCKGEPFEEMSNLPLPLRQKLRENALETGVTIYKQFVSAKDGTIKYLFLLQDSQIVEGVLMKHDYGNSLCISNQVGCAMHCSFCASGIDGLVRNLSAGEILGQVIAVNGELGKQQQRVDHIVMMGSGEPLDNYDNSVRFLRLVNREDGLHIGYRNISLSTCGLPSGIVALANEHIPVTLSISLHAPNDEIRQKIMPVARRYPLKELFEAARYYVQETGRRVVFEYVLIEDVNDTPQCAKQLSGLMRNLQCHINLIPLNRVREHQYLPPDYARVAMFEKILNDLHVSVTVRREMGADIEGACGQLRRRELENKL
ncbi:MAG: 23S rRNA (adenine(2503)-C(2))-methyltransferase RlmN [Christensenellales bacterium]